MRQNSYDAEGVALLGMSADALHALKEAGDGSYERALRAAQWTDWVFKCKVKTELYQGEARRRVTAVSMSKPDYAAECKAMLQLIKGN